MARTDDVTTQPPPPRWRVVEQGWRLVVIDTQTGAPATRSPTPAKGALPTLPRRIDFAGRSTLVTHPLYDARGPRTLTLDEGATRRIETVRTLLIAIAVVFVVATIFLPWLLLSLVVLVNPKARGAVRDVTTQWLDRHDPSVGAG